MANDEENKELDFDNMSDDDFLKLPEPSEEEPVVEEEEVTNEVQEQELDNPEQPPADSIESDGSGSDSDPSESQGEEEVQPEEGQELQQPNPMEGQGQEAPSEETPVQTDKQPEADPKEEGKEIPESKGESELSVEETANAVAFYKALTTPFKADGKDFVVRSAEDAIRLIQQGMNYSRRMQELKPIKHLNRMLTDHGLNDEAKLSFLIDVSRGDKQAITKLLKEKGLDPMDLDTSGEIGYQAKSYAANPEENAFRDALDNTMSTPDGQALISDIHQNWDDASKQQLQKNPAILGNLMEMRQSGVYSKIVDELAYQRGLGYLTEIPFLQAFDQVGEAMKNVGVFDKPQPAPAANPMGQLQSNTQPEVKPVASGARKAPATKKPEPNPHLSSTPPTKQTGNATTATPNFDKMSDEEFLKMAPPE